MHKHPTISGKQTIKSLEKLNFKIVSQKGSHIKLIKYAKGQKIITIVPNHKELDRFTLKGILELAKVSQEDFFKNI